MGCFDENTALGFVQGGLDEERAREVERHAAGCAECRWRLAAAAGGTTTEALAVGERARAGPMPDAGQLLSGGYRLERRIGVGGMGIVFEATRVRHQERVAVKLLAVELRSDPVAVARLRREAEITRKLSHPNIVELVGFEVTEQGLPFLVMELLEGEPLLALLKRERIVHQVERLAAIVQQTASALGAAHARGVVHRDLKPANLFLCAGEDGQMRLKVMDFGISKVAGSTSELTREVAVLGSPGYMSPEQARGESAEVDLRADIFSLGAIIYRMLVGTRPFGGGSSSVSLRRLVHEPPARPPEWERLPPALQQVVLRALSKDPAERQQSMDQLWSELRAALESCGGDTVEEPLPPAERDEEEAPSPARRWLPGLLGPARRRWLLGGGAALAAASCAIVVYLLLAPSAAPPADGEAPPVVLRRVAVPDAAAALDAGAKRADATPVVDVSPRRHPAQAQGWITVQTKTADGRHVWADVYLGNRRIGRTPVMERQVPAGTHHLMLRRRGYRAARRSVVVRPGAREVVRVVLQPRGE